MVVPDAEWEWRYLAHDDLDPLARADGFANFEEMAEWFAAQYGLPFSGYLHKWMLAAEAAP